MRSQFTLACGVLGLGVLLTSASAVHASSKKAPTLAPVNASRVWPPPPQKARYKLLQIMGGEGDVVVKKKTGLLSRMIADKDAPRYIHFRRPHGLAGDQHGKLYVTDTYLKTIFVIDPLNRTFRLFGADNPDLKFRQPLALHVDSQDRVWIADAGAATVFCVSPDEKLLLEFGHDPGDEAHKTPVMERPAGIAVDEKRQRVYVSDARLSQVFVFDTNGQFLTRFGKIGVQPGEFYDPGALLVDREGRIYVADTMNARVQIFDAEFNLIKVVGERCDHPGCFARPKGMALDNDGHLYVSDSWFHNVQVFGHDPRDADPEKLSVLLFIGEGGIKPGEFQGPGGIFVNKFNQVFVADQLNGRIQVLQYLGGDESKP